MIIIFAKSFQIYEPVADESFLRKVYGKPLSFALAHEDMEPWIWTNQTTIGRKLAIPFCQDFYMVISVF